MFGFMQYIFLIFCAESTEACLSLHCQYVCQLGQASPSYHHRRDIFNRDVRQLRRKSVPSAVANTNRDSNESDLLFCLLHLRMGSHCILLLCQLVFCLQMTNGGQSQTSEKSPLFQRARYRVSLSKLCLHSICRRWRLRKQSRVTSNW